MRPVGSFILAACWLGAAGTLAACSLLVDTNGLTGSDAGASEAGSADGAALDGGSEAGSTDGGGAADAGPLCQGGTRYTTFDGFTPTGPVTVNGRTLTATASTSAIKDQSAALVRRDFNPAPPRIHLAYDLTLERSNVLYVEPGCGLYLQNDADTNLRHSLYNDHGDVGQYLNSGLPDGGEAQRSHEFLQLPASGSTTHHVDVDVLIAGTDVTIRVTMDASTQTDELVMPQLTSAFFLRCGVIYANRYSSSSGTGSTTVTIDNPELTLCP